MGRNTKEKIIIAFLNLADKNQGKHISIAALCKRARISKPTFYRYFESIDALLSYLREDLDKEIFGVLMQHSAMEQTNSFEVLVDEVLPILYANRTKLRVIYTSFVDPRWIKFLEERYAEWLRPFFEGREKIYDFQSEFLVSYVTKVVISIISTWLTETVPEEPKLFKGKFLALTELSLSEIIKL